MHKKSNYRVIIWVITTILLIIPVVFTGYKLGWFEKEPVIDTAITAGEDAPVLRIAADGNFKPKSYTDSQGNIAGADVEIAIEIANRLNMRPEITFGEWLECRDALKNGDADILLGLEIFSNMEGAIKTIPILTDNLRVYGKTEVVDAGALAGKKVAVMGKSVIISMYELNCEYVEYYSNEDILKAVENGEADYAICHEAVADWIIDDNNFSLVKCFVLMESYPAIGLREDNVELRDKINEVLMGMAEDGTLQKYKSKWIESSKDNNIDSVINQNKELYLMYIMFFFGIEGLTLFFISQQKNYDKQKELNSELNEQRKRLSNVNEEQEAQLEEIKALNTKLEEKQTLLEESAAEQRKHLEEITNLNKEIEERINVIQAMNKIYFVSYYINLEDESFFEIKNREFVRAQISEGGKASDNLKVFVERMIQDDNVDEIKAFVNLSTLNARMKDKPVITCEYIGKVAGWCQLFFIEGTRDEEGNLETVFLAARTIHDEKERENEANALIEGLSQEYHTVWLINKDTMDMKLIRSTGVSTIKGAIDMALEKVKFGDVVKGYIEKYIDPVDKKRATETVTTENILREMDENGFFAFNYLRRDENGHAGYHQISFVNADTETGKKQFVAGFRDIDKIVQEEKALKQELQDAKHAAEEANRSKSNFLFNMSHDIRTPLNAILGFTQLIEKHPENAEQVANYVKKIEESGDDLLFLINNVLDMARIESGKMELNESEMNIEDVRNHINDLFEGEARKKNIVIHDNMNITHKHIIGDKARTIQVIMNIMSNAIKYTPEGGRIDINANEVSSDKEGFVKYCITIADNGIGMSKEFVKVIFDSFSRERTTTESRVAGTGLGMSIVKKLVDLMGGTITVESEQGKGSVFTLTFFNKIVEDTTDSVANIEENKTFSLAGKRILLAEDNDINAEIAEEILTDAGVKMERASDGQECVDMLLNKESGYYDLILMDIQMPNLNGYDATKKIRSLEDKDKANICIIAMTANAFEEDRKNALEAGMNEHITKPFKIEEMIDIISKVFNK